MLVQIILGQVPILYVFITIPDDRTILSGIPQQHFPIKLPMLILLLIKQPTPPIPFPTHQPLQRLQIRLNKIPNQLLLELKFLQFHILIFSILIEQQISPLLIHDHIKLMIDILIVDGELVILYLF